MRHALFAIKETLQGEKLTSAVCTLAVVGAGEPFRLVPDQAVQQMVDGLDDTLADVAAEDDDAAGATPEASPDDESNPAAPAPMEEI